MEETGLPEFSAGEYGPECEVSLPAWEDFYWIPPVGGPITLDLGGDEEPLDPPSAAQERAWDWLSAHQEEICGQVLAAVFGRMEELYEDLGREEMDDEEPWEEELGFPEVSFPGELRDWMRLRRIHILNPERDGVAYTGYEFACSWDGERGLGVLVHKSRVVEVGGADTSVLSWLARDDAEKPDAG
ncbi:MAG: hypothetical protein PHD67_06005 [Oscillospiraceae bacterium]|nr:hypothetical protein [Oscillospiraceae bacterium]